MSIHGTPPSTVAKFKNCIKEWKLTFMSPATQANQVAFLLKQVQKPVQMGVWDFAQHIKTIAQYLKEMPYRDPLVTIMRAQLHCMFLRSMPWKWQENFARARTDPDLCPFTLVVDFMQQEREFKLRMQSQVTQGGWGHPGHTNHYPFSNSDPIRSFHQAGNCCSRGSQHNCPFGHQFYQHNTTAGGDASGCRHGSCQLWRNCYLNPNHHPYQPREQPNNYGHPTGHANTQAGCWRGGWTGPTRSSGYTGVMHINNNTTSHFPQEVHTTHVMPIPTAIVPCQANNSYHTEAETK